MVVAVDDVVVVVVVPIVVIPLPLFRFGMTISFFVGMTNGRRFGVSTWMLLVLGKRDPFIRITRRFGRFERCDGFLLLGPEVCLDIPHGVLDIFLNAPHLVLWYTSTEQQLRRG